MFTDLWGNVTKDAVDYAEEVIRDLDAAQNISFQPNYKDTNKGVVLFPDDIRLPENAIHCIYRNNVPLYVGYSGNSTRERLGKFCGAVRGTLRDDERHIGGERYKQVFGDNFDGVTVRAVEYYAGQDLSVKVSEITKEIAILLNATFNDVIYKKANPNAESDTDTDTELEAVWNKF
jgi:hypothetical protein